MSTRSVTKIKSEGKLSPTLVAIYQHFDGYFSGVGKQLQDFLRGMKVVSGMGIGIPKKSANGMGCLAAQLIAHLKTGIGDVYITSIDDNREYEYRIFLDETGNLVLEGFSNYEDEEYCNFDLNEKPQTI